VVLTGEGADETLAGYLPHKVMFWAREYVRRVPKSLRRGIFEPLLQRTPNKMLNLAFSYPGELGTRGKQKLLDYLSLVNTQQSRAEYYFLISLFDKRDKTSLYESTMQGQEHDHAAGNVATALQAPPSSNGSYLDEILALQYENWLQDCILMKQDKMTMANSIEGRVPFLDPPLVELLLSTPPHLKMGGLMDKAILRDYLAQIAPSRVARRKKVPFYIPIDQYFGKGPLKEIMETCLSEKSVRNRGYFKWEHVRSLRNSMNQNNFMVGKQVFALVMLELWHRIFIDRESGWV
jgi:asparagine synthase (glutamine-hydrolysing)